MKNYLLKYLPVIQVLKGYNLDKARSDALAGLTVGIVLIPQGMAYAVLAGLPPIYGLYAGLVPLIIFPLFSTSRHLSIGPVALDMIILAAGLGFVSAGNTGQLITFALLIAVMTGLIQIGMGLLKMGFIFNLFSRPVISGFTIAAPVIIIVSQLGTLLQIQIPGGQPLHETLFYIYQHAGELHIPSLYISLLFIGVLVGFKKFTPKLPESVLLVVLTLICSVFVEFESFGISQIGAIPSGLPEPGFSLPDIATIKQLSSTAFTLAVIQFMTVASLSKSFARKHDYSTDPNRELLALGSSNVFGGIFQALPVSGSFSRSAIAEQTGAKTLLSNYVAAAMILLTLLYLTPVFSVLPDPMLGAIIVVSVFSLIDIKEINFLFNTKRRDALVAMITFASVLLIGIQEGIITGLVASVVAILIKLGKPTVAELGVIPESRMFKSIHRFEEAEQLPGILILRIDASFSFVNAQFFKNFILEKSIGRDKHTQFVIIDGSTIGDLDISAIETLEMIIETLNEQGIELYISGLIGPVRDVIRKSEVQTFFKSDRFFNSVHDAVEAALNQLDDKDEGGRLKDYKEISI